MAVTRATVKKTAKPAAKKPAKKAAPKARRTVTLEDLQTIVADIGTAHKGLEQAQKETMAGFRKSQRMIDELRLSHKETWAALKETQRIVASIGSDHKETETALKETRRIVGDLGLSRTEREEEHKKTEATLRETQRIVGDLGSSHEELKKAQEEAWAAIKEAQRIVGDLGNKFGEDAEYTLIPGLMEKFKQFGFSFGSISRNKKINNSEYDIRAEVDAFLENGTQAMAVEVKAKLQNDDVDKHIKRMEKLRKYADLFGDKRELYGALAATVVQEKQRNYALENGFYVIEPSGEDIRVIQPDTAPKVW